MIKKSQGKLLEKEEDKAIMELISPASETNKVVLDELINNTLIIYASGSVGANQNLQIQKDGLKQNFRKNFYLCDQQKTVMEYPNYEYLISPPNENGIRIRYKFVQLDNINTSINMQLDIIYRIAEEVFENYQNYDSFIVITGFDTICFVSSALSFIFENLSKLVVFTGGYLPLKKMRNDSVMNIIESFAVISEAYFMNQVLIVIKNHGFRANRCVKERQGDFLSIGSPNLEALTSIKIKLRVRSELFQVKPTEQFKIFKDMCSKVKILKYHIYGSLQALEYEVMNPFISGIVIESFSSANLPQKQQVLNIFKKAHEEKGIIFINIPQSQKSKNQSIMQKYLEEYHIFYGGDMTCEAALAKLSYLLGKGYSTSEIKDLVQTNLRGQLTEIKNENQYELENNSFMKIVDDVIEKHYPTTFKQKFITKLEHNVSQYVTPTATSQDFESIFHQKTISKYHTQEDKIAQIMQIINKNYLLHQAVIHQNKDLVDYFMNIGAEVNLEDEDDCSPMFYALKKGDKCLIQTLARSRGRVICPLDEIIQIFIEALKKDDIDFFILLYHTQFKKTLKDIVNSEERNIGHLSCLIGANKCSKYLKEKFQINFKTVDSYGQTAEKYLELKGKKINQSP